MVIIIKKASILCILFTVKVLITIDITNLHIMFYYTTTTLFIWFLYTTHKKITTGNINFYIKKLLPVGNIQF